MEIDKTTYQDLSIFYADEESSLFHHLDFTRTSVGQAELRRIFLHPLKSIEEIHAVQEIVQFIFQHIHQWEHPVTNGTIVMIEEYLNARIDTDKPGNNPLSGFFQHLWFHTLRKSDYSYLCFALSHVADLIRGCQYLVQLLLKPSTPRQLANVLQSMKQVLSLPEASAFNHPFHSRTPVRVVLQAHETARRYFRSRLQELMRLYAHLDAWYAMAKAMKTYDLVIPVFTSAQPPFLKVKGIFHPLLKQPVRNDLQLSREQNFLFLTGANMAGKSTLIKAIGIAVFLAHIGMGVPAYEMELSLFDGMLTNIHVDDDIIHGKSYFYNEVHRIKNTIEKIQHGKYWLVLIDELFKGTNVDDARNCSVAVIRGLASVRDSLFILSTHLYEIAEQLKSSGNIQFRYFEVQMEEGKFQFNYHLREGISQDRLGYLILKQEKVLDMLNHLQQHTQS
ncbi:MutS-like protein [Thermoflavifilum aggregans]|uniref:MutS-like protein n=1 Tax=Thermoflavifilum aggregans TaxID=454188 RepID=A0A2M9CTF5_9BACT|nr:DNA mismatch repair protein MutS [Thermoflavifilum aggregans]PJJ75151.1 MutS-like protein [Thermoflavifilum aggregans]